MCTGKNLEVDTVAGDLAVKETRLLEGGTIDLELKGAWSRSGVGYIDLPLNITVRNSTLSLPGAGSTEVSNLELPIGIRGALDRPLHLHPARCPPAGARGCWRQRTSGQGPG